MEHSPTPWKTCVYRHPDGKINGEPYSTTCNGRFTIRCFSNELSIADLEHAVHCVNVHDDLRDSLQDMVDAAVEVAANWERGDLAWAVSNLCLRLQEANGTLWKIKEASP